MSTQKPSRTPRPRATQDLPARPDPDHLRRQAKQLLTRLRAGDTAAADAVIAHLPAARDLSRADVLRAGYRLADMQSAVARRLGFAGWPALSRHVETLRALEGTWGFVSLEVDGQAIPGTMLSASRILMDGDRFRTESPEANYDGEFSIDVEAEPHTIDIDFVEGPEAGNRSLGIFTLDGDTLRICLGLTGATRPTAFVTAPGSGHAFEVLHRTSPARPADVTGGRPASATRTTAALPSPAQPPTTAATPFVATPCAFDTTLAGEWTPLELVIDGKPMPTAWLSAGRRTTTGGVVEVTFGGQRMVHARVRYDDTHTPAHVDYLHLSGASSGAIAHGICAYDGVELRVTMAQPGAPRPDDWSSAPGSGRTFSRWARR